MPVKDSDMDLEEDEFNQGIILPPLIVQLRKILDQYPDDGQILKELIQNAEDAGATEVKFLYDRHSYGTDPDLLHHPGLTRFQGPALYSHNNALFTDDDWRGIRMLSQSVKQNDPLKVGYFGMGFKSVFHMTDLPCILSGDRLGMIDPHQMFFPASTYSWHLEKKREAMQKTPHQFDPFKGIFESDERVFMDGFYNGTLFRFPLRNVASPLSDRLYTHDKAERLYQSFMADAHLVLLFLKYLESVELYEREVNETNVRLIFKVRISEDTLLEVRQKRSEFLRRVRSRDYLDKPMYNTYPLTIEVSSFNGDCETIDTYRWLVTNYYCGSHMSATFRKLHKESDLNYLPWIAAAMPLDADDSEAEVDHKEADGHVFCFLPLALEDKSQTGLPVHINGFFALEQNRKHLKWPNISQRRDTLMDPKLIWNQCMLTEALPKVYIELLIKAIERHRQGRDVGLNRGSIYRAFPDFRQVDKKWEMAIVPLYSELFQHSVVYTNSAGGQWVRTRDAVFNTLSQEEDTQQLILDILSSGNVMVANVPRHVLQALERCALVHLAKITPDMVGSTFKAVQYNTTHDRHDKMKLLRYLLKQEKFDYLNGLELLPLASGCFTTFTMNARRAQKLIYIESPDHPLSLLPGMDNDFLDLEIDEDIKKMLFRAASRGYTQLKFLDPYIVSTLLPLSLPADWMGQIHVTWTPGQNGHPTWDWLAQVWIYLQRHYGYDLQPFENLPLIPSSPDGDNLELVALTPHAALMVRTMDGLTIEEGIEETLQKLGIRVIDEVPAYIKGHPLTTKRYVRMPSYVGILRTMDSLRNSLGEQEFIELFQKSTEDIEKRRLRGLFSRANPSDLNEELTDFLKTLPLFETLAGSGSKEAHFVSCKEVAEAAPLETLPIPVEKMLLDISAGESNNLAVLLHVPQYNMSELLTQVVFPSIEEAFYDISQVETLMVHVLKHFHTYLEVDQKFTDTVRSLTFLAKGEMLVTPDRFYDPDHELLQYLFFGEDNFPTGAFADPSLIAILREVGLRGVNDVEPEDILCTATVIEAMTESAEPDVESLNRKSDALMEYLVRRTDVLDAECDGQPLYQWLKDIAWVKPLHDKPAFYPQMLQWYENGRPFQKPSNMKHRMFSSVVGSVGPIVAAEVPNDMSEKFKWSHTPELHRIIMHLQNTVLAYQGKEKAKYMEMGRNIYTELNKFQAEVILENLSAQDVKDWIWHGEGFASPDRVVFSDPFTDLRPYIYSLPTEVQAFRPLFESCEVRQSVNLPAVLWLIKERNESEDHLSDLEVRRDLHLSISILNELKAHIIESELTELQENLVLPVHFEAETYVKMARLMDCTYCDQEWLRQGHDLGEMEEEDDKLIFVHPNLPTPTAEALGVPTLMSRMLDAEELDFSFGQTDSLTHRLNVLLQEYTDGFAVPKELVQNADDAGATEVKLLYDQRQNTDARTCLIDEGMKDCQGPALWAYNDAVFTDDDFENITKLSGATKENQNDKIGRFGLGFNAVYNLTDVPSFISRHNIVIFDPHTFHLGKSIKNKAKPGIKIDMNKHRKKLRRLGNQFKPYNNVFGCNLKPDTDQESYDATLFRFPLRTKAQAIRSEICQRHYDDKEMKALLHILMKGANNLLLFTQNVMQLTVYHIPPHGDASRPFEMFHINKGPIKIFRELSLPDEHLSIQVQALPQEKRDFAKECNILRASTNALNKIKEGHGLNQTIVPESSMIINIECQVSQHGSVFFQKPATRESNLWLLCSCMGTEEALRMSLMEENLLPTAGVAVPLQQIEDDRFVPSALFGSTDQGLPKHNGTVFTYLPLPIRTGLPVHINGAFSVSSSRRYLCEHNEDDKFDIRAIWNEALMEDGICKAYMLMLEDLAYCCAPPLEVYDFTSLWPSVQYVESNSKQLMGSVYRKIATVDIPPLLSDSQTWVNMSKAVFLEESFRNSEVGLLALQIFRDCVQGTELAVIDLDPVIRESFYQAGCMEIINDQSHDAVKFFRETLLPHVLEVEQRLRDPLILFALKDNNYFLDELLQNTPCIPVTPDGECLKMPSELIDPTSSVASMFSPLDGRFPYNSEIFGSKDVLSMLRRVGIITDELSWADMVERAESISVLEFDEGCMRAAALLEHIGKKLQSSDYTADPCQDQLASTKFLPLMERPKAFPLMWKGETYEPKSFLSPDEVYDPRFKQLICCVHPVCCDSVLQKIPEEVRAFIGLSNKEPEIQDVLTQLEILIQGQDSMCERDTFEEIRKAVFAVYGYLQWKCEESEEAREYIKSELQGKTFILVQGTFLSSSQVAFSFKYDCAPYLYGLPEDMRRSFDILLHLVGVTETFRERDFVTTLQIMHAHYDLTQLDQEALRLALRLVNLLNDSLAESNLALTEVVDMYGTIYIPDSENILRAATDLCYNEPECQWLPPDEQTRFSHPNIPFSISKQLGVNTRRQEMLRKHSRGIPFGQREKLTTRIKRILSSYPCDKEILKELLQNADDATATDVHFVKDPRFHSNERVFDDSWKPLQGPALCVFNNRPFTETDIKGIQSLGEGSKTADPNQTGQYGVGFNSVYHLTDAPSFLSCGPDIGETLCIFDPHGKYVPGASKEEPGRRYEDVTELRNVFTDVFPCYLEDKFDLSNGTMFRFPLRNHKMAKGSELSNTPITIDELEKLIGKFRAEIYDCLLFVNNIRSVSFSDIDRLTHRLSNTYTVSVELSEEDEIKREEFAAELRTVAKQLAKQEITLQEVPMQEVSYTMTIADNKGYWEKWLVVQRLGFEPGQSVSPGVLEAFKAGELLLLPRGGVAALLATAESNLPHRNKRIFCFLPLPLKSDLPVNINGHFALDHEARRNLWRDDDFGAKTEWNLSLIQNVIGPAYVTLVETARSYYFGDAWHDGIVLSTRSNGTAHENLRQYTVLFPQSRSSDGYWENCINAFYYNIDLCQVEVLPVVRGKSTDQNDGQVTEIQWLPSKGNMDNRPYFDNLDETFGQEDDFGFTLMTPRARKRSGDISIQKAETVRRVLLDSGFNLLKLPLTILHGFSCAHVEMECVSPESVIHFFASYGTGQSTCTLGQLPYPITSTAFKSEQTLETFVRYCQMSPDFLDCLCGLPMLLTEDGELRVFSSSSPVYLSTQYDLLPSCAHMFVHRTLVSSVFKGIVPEQNPVFERFDIGALANLLSYEIDEAVYKNALRHVRWEMEANKLPNAQWIWMLWTFLREECERLLTDISDDFNEEHHEWLEGTLWPLREWCLLPAHVPTPHEYSSPRTFYNTGNANTGEQYLVPIGLANTVIDFHNLGVMTYTLREALRKLKLHELASTILDGGTMSPMGIGRGGSFPNSAFVRNIVASLEKPQPLLQVLNYAASYMHIAEALKMEESNLILKYFSDSADSWQERQANIQILRSLPMFLSVDGDMISLDSNIAYVLPNDIPTTDMSAWQTQAGIVFLRKDASLMALFEALNCTVLNVADVYLNFIFKHFELLSEEGRIKHLEFLKDVKLPKVDQAQHESLLAGLKELAFLDDGSGNLQKASFFFDPCHSVFRAMLVGQVAAFPPKPFEQFKWLDLLRMIGLQHVVSPEMLISFAEEVASKAAVEPTEELFHQARTLVAHLFKRHNVATEGILESMRTIQFIPAMDVNFMLQKIQGQFQTREDGSKPYISFDNAVTENHEYLVWTSSHLLPHWANPLKLTPNDVSFNYPEDNSLKDFDKYRAEIAKVLGITDDPPVRLVVKHCQNLCNTAYDTKSTGEDLIAFMKADVMKVVYRFLQKKCLHDDEAKEALRNTACIVVDQGSTFVLPHQVVINLYEDEQIIPYLYKAPTELGEFEKLFHYLGATIVATADQYAMVLSDMYNKTQSWKMHPNELRLSFKAVNGLFSNLQRSKQETLSVEDLYLPSQTGQLALSKELVFNDDPSYTDRIKDFEKLFLVDLAECGLTAVNYEDMVKLLPSSLQPVMLTSLVQEVLEEHSKDTEEQFGPAEKLKHQLNSKAFSLGVIRLIRHEQHRSGHRVKQNLIDSIQDRLSGIRVFGVKQVMTYLSYNRERIPGSEIESECFVEESGEETVKLWKIYIKNTASLSEELLVSVAEVVNRIIGGVLRNSVHYLQPILSCQPHNISKVLDRLKIRPDHSVDFKQPTLPLPGSYIPIEDHHLLREDFEKFDNGEYVGYELDDPGDHDDDGSATYVYAIIIECLPDETEEARKSAPISTKYKINIGDDRKPVIAIATDLYKFHRIEGYVSRDSSFFETSAAAQPTMPQRSFSSPADARIYEEEEPEPPQRESTPIKRQGSVPNIEFDPDKGMKRRSMSTGSVLDPHFMTHFEATEEHYHEEVEYEQHHTREGVFTRDTLFTDDTDDATGDQIDGRHRSSTRLPRDAFTDEADGLDRNQSFEGYARYCRKETKNTYHARHEEHGDGYSRAHETGGGTFSQSEEFQSEGQHSKQQQQFKFDYDTMHESGKTPEEIKNELSDTLEAAWKLTDSERKKVIKRLLLRWHPDKNVGNEQLSTGITQHITSEIERLEQGLPRDTPLEDIGVYPDARNPFSQDTQFQRNFQEAFKFFMDQINQRAKQHKKQRERYRENFSRNFSSAQSNFKFDVPPSFSSSNPQPSQAKRWLKQAQEDLKAADNDYEAKNPAYEWACLKTHQAAEKALKAAQFSVDAIASHSHDLVALAGTLGDFNLKLLATKMQKILGNANKLYQPNPVDFHTIPHEEFTRDMACDAVMCAADIVDKVREFIDQRESYA